MWFFDFVVSDAYEFVFFVAGELVEVEIGLDDVAKGVSVSSFFKVFFFEESVEDVVDF